MAIIVQDHSSMKIINIAASLTLYCYISYYLMTIVNPQFCGYFVGIVYTAIPTVILFEIFTMSFLFFHYFVEIFMYFKYTIAYIFRTNSTV